jgi:molecular chaperone DnaJ
MAKRDYYQVLELTRSATDAEIKKAYRRLAMKLHPDRNPDHETEEKFKEAKEAYEVLSDPHKRATYDQFGHAGVEAASRGGPGGGAGMDPRDAFGDIFGDVFGDIFGAGRRGRSQVFRGADLRYELELDLEQAVFGDTVNIEFTTLGRVRCVHRQRFRQGFETDQLRDLPRHAGQVRMQQGFFTVQQTCPRCQGQAARSSAIPAASVAGRDACASRRRCAVKVPPGVDSGDRIRLGG